MIWPNTQNLKTDKKKRLEGENRGVLCGHFLVLDLVMALWAHTAPWQFTELYISELYPFLYVCYTFNKNVYLRN